MPVKNRNELKGYFLTGLRPTQEQFGFLIDSLVHKSQDIMIDINGNVGIGTPQPSEKLEIKGGSLKIADSTNSLTLGPTDIRFKKDSNFPYISNLGAGGLAFSTGGGVGFERMVINNEGNIGISKSTPVARLEISGGPKWTTSNWDKALKLNNGNAMLLDSAGTHENGTPTITKFGIGASSWNEMLYYFTSNGEDQAANINYYMMINKDGKIGIGTNLPTADLHLAHTRILGIGPWEISQEGGGNTISYLRIDRWTGDGNTTWKQEMAALDYSGNLRLAGDIKTSLGFNAVVPDYVFDEGYDLLKIDDLEYYIQENKHLPDIPSKFEIENNGLILGALTLSLLKKVEELFLYIIQMNKEIQGLKNLKQN